MNKKILASISVGLLMAASVLAQVEPGQLSQCTLMHDFSGWSGIRCPASGVCEFTNASADCAVCCVLDTVYTVTDWLFYGVVSIAIILVVLGAYKIMTAGGNPENVNVGRQYIMWSMVGLAVALLAKSIPAIVKALLRLG